LTSSHWMPTDDEQVLETTVATILQEAARIAPETVALVEGLADPSMRRRFTYAELLDGALATGTALSVLFDPGERIASISPSTPEALVLSYAAAFAGLVLVPVNPSLREGEISYLLAQSGAAGIVAGPEHRSRDLFELSGSARREAASVRDVLKIGDIVSLGAGTGVSSGPNIADLEGRLPGPDDVAQIVYTSGTTGFPKGARLSHSGMTNAARFGGARFGLQPGDVYVDTMPLHHVGGQVVAFQICQHLATAVLVAGFEAGLVLELFESEHANVTAGVPTMLVSLIEHPAFAVSDHSALRTISSGGSVVPPELVRHIESALGARFTICFGQTETCGFISQTHLDDSAEDKASTLGQPLPRVEARVVATSLTPGAAAGTVVERGDVGELEVRAPFVMDGYHEMPEATEAAFSEGGWLRTGDLVRMDDRGFLRISGRVKDMIVTGGENVFPVEIEGVLCEHPEVALAAVFGVADHEWGERVVAVVKPAPGAEPDPEQLVAYLKERLAPFKIPKQIHLADEFPLTASGKVQKFVLRDRLAGRERGPQI
jgi:fatty-acyl-CoA synthase